MCREPRNWCVGCGRAPAERSSRESDYQLDRLSEVRLLTLVRLSKEQDNDRGLARQACPLATTQFA